MTNRIRLAACLTFALVGVLRWSAAPSSAHVPAPPPERVDYKVLATNKTSTMQSIVRQWVREIGLLYVVCT